MIAHLEDLLLNTPLDLSLCRLSRGPDHFLVETKIGVFRILIFLFFTFPCFLLLYSALMRGAGFITLAAIFCPPLALLGCLFGFLRQKKTFIASADQAIKSYRLFGFEKKIVVGLPPKCHLRRFQTSHMGEVPCSIYHVEIAGLPGFGFCIAREKKAMDTFTTSLATFLGYEIQQGMT